MSKNPKPKAKEAVVIVRLDPDLKDQVEAKAKSRGWSLGALTRALYRFWLVEDVVSPDDVGEELKRSPKIPRKKRTAGTGTDDKK